MDVHQLRTFVAVARDGSITRAAERLCLSQPAVSAHIKAMEDIFGFALFDRTPKGMAPTADGRKLLAKAERVLDAHRALIEEAGRLKGRLSGRLRLGAAGDTAAHALGRLLSAFAEHHPEVEVTLSHDPSLTIRKDIRSGALDAGFFNEAGEIDADLSAVEVGRFGIYLAAPSGLIDTAAPLDWPALAEQPWIYPASGACCGQAAERLFQAHAIRPGRVIAVDRESVTRTLIAGGVGLGLLHADKAMEAQAKGEVDLLCEVQPVVRILFAFRTDRANDPLLSTAAAILTAAPE